MEKAQPTNSRFDFSIVFEKLEQAKLNSPGLDASLQDPGLNDSIRQIKEIVESYSAPNNLILFTSGVSSPTTVEFVF
jgi:hypothetical protein